jgi:cytochrome c1
MTKSVGCIRGWQCAVLLCITAGVTSGCVGGRTVPGYPITTGGNARRGQEVIVQFRCGMCHDIPGISGADGVFGPPLDFLGRRTFIAGNFPNTSDNLVNWIKQPQAMKPKTAMPDLGLSDQQARDVAAYLYKLR